MEVNRGYSPGRGNASVQWQVSPPVQNFDDGYFYQRARSLYKYDDGTVTYGNEVIHKSVGPNSDRA